MYCPKCGDVMERRDEALVCLRGAMPLSQALERSLASRIDEDIGSPDDSKPAGFAIGVHWYCPADGSAMRAEAGVVRCPRCARCLTRSEVFQLVEIHPHRAV